MNLVRLQKIIADRGYCSRRKAEEYILEGKVFVDGIKVTALGGKYDEDTVVILVNGTKLAPIIKTNYTYLMLNKPLGYVSTAHDDRNRKTVLDLIPKTYGRLFPVGRLDINTSGLILLTDDGEFANLVTHPSSNLNKTYRAIVQGNITSYDVSKLENGIKLEDGITSPSKVKLLKVSQDETILEISIHEGKKRQIRRMFESLNHPVKALKRISISIIELGDLEPGHFKQIDKKVIEEIKIQCFKGREIKYFKPTD